MEEKQPPEPSTSENISETQPSSTSEPEKQIPVTPPDLIAEEKQDDPDLQQPAVADKETINAITDKAETTTMEVHHHGHVHEKKKWKEYLFQFLMLFLAVFLGFLAEYKLEHVIEHNREKQYIKSLIEGLKSDTASLTESIISTQSVILGKDSFILLLDKQSLTQADVTQLYHYHKKYMGADRPFFASKGTITQLLNAGGLRLIRNHTASDSITSYSISLQLIEEYLLYNYLEYLKNSMTLSGNIFDNKYIRLLPLGQSNFSRPVFDTLSNPALLSTDRKEIKKFAFALEMDKDMGLGALVWFQQHKEKAERLIALLEKEYHLQ